MRCELKELLPSIRRVCLESQMTMYVDFATVSMSMRSAIPLSALQLSAHMVAINVVEHIVGQRTLSVGRANKDRKNARSASVWA